MFWEKRGFGDIRLLIAFFHFPFHLLLLITFSFGQFVFFNGCLFVIYSLYLWPGRRVEFVFPAGNDNGGKAVADDIDGGAGHVHQFVDSQDDVDGPDRQAKSGGGGQ